MTITQDQIKHLAKLAKLDFSKEELEKFSKDFNNIVSYFSQLDEVDAEILKKVDPIKSKKPLVLRKDEADENRDYTKKDLLSCTTKPVINDQIALGNIMN